MNRTNFILLFVAIMSLSLSGCFEGKNEIAQFGGSNRDGVYNETGLLNKWPDSGPELLHTISGIGDGYGSPAINEEGLFIAGMLDTTGYVFHYGHDHQLKWKYKVGPEFTYKYEGARSTPTVEDGRLYFCSSEGDAVCLNTENGEVIWKMNIFEKFDGKEIKWGYTESPLIYEDKVFFTPGGSLGNFVALNKNTGETIWTVSIDSAKNAYCSPVMIEHGGKKYILFNSSHYLLGIDPENGDVLIKHPLMKKRETNPLAPMYYDGKILVSIGYGVGAALLDLEEGKAELDTLFSNQDFDCKMCGMIRYDGIVYGVGDKKKQWIGIDQTTGETVFTNRDLKPGSFIFADDKFYLYSDVGEVALAKPSSSGFEIVSRFNVPAEQVKMAFAHPVLYDGVLYLRYNNDLWLYQVK